MTGIYIFITFFYCFYIFMILLIGIGTMDYCGNMKLFWLDLFIPFFRLMREIYMALFDKETN